MSNYNPSTVWRDRLTAAEQASRSGKVDEAEMLYQQALNLAASGGNTEDLVTTLVHLADYHQARNQLVQAESYYRRCVDLYEKQFGQTFVTAVCLKSLAENLRLQGKTSESEVLFQQAQSIICGA